MKRTLIILAVLLLLPISASFNNNVSAAEQTFSAALSGADEVPAVETAAIGQATFTVVDDGKGLEYKVTVDSIENVTAAHIHMGKPGENGPILVFLYPGPEKKGMVNGTLVEGTIKAEDLHDVLRGKSIADLIEKIKSGDTYVSVHTTRNPAGEIRGQIK